jgi:hypothetical protein
VDRPGSTLRRRIATHREAARLDLDRLGASCHHLTAIRLVLLLYRHHLNQCHLSARLMHIPQCHRLTARRSMDLRPSPRSPRSPLPARALRVLLRLSLRLVLRLVQSILLTAYPKLSLVPALAPCPCPAAECERPKVLLLQSRL